MSTEQNDFENFRPEPNPKVIWNTEIWLTILSYLLAIALLCFPNLLNLEEYNRLRVVGSIVLLILPGAIAIIIWITRKFKRMCFKLTNYEKLFGVHEDSLIKGKSFREQITQITRELLSSHSLDVQSIHFTNGFYSIIVKKSDKIKLNQGDILLLYDALADQILGIYAISLIKEESYEAMTRDGLDPVLAGYLRVHKDIDYLANTCALHYSKGE